MMKNNIIQIIGKILLRKPLTEEERFFLIYSKKIDPEVFSYLSSVFQNLTISVLGEHQGSILELMVHNLLLGWCYQTTSTAILFLNEDDFIERGTVVLESRDLYEHAWISFWFHKEQYVFDPSLNVLCLKKDYDKIFSSHAVSHISSLEVKNYFLECMRTPKPERNDSFSAFIDSICSPEQLERRKNEVSICGIEDIHAPFFRGNVGYTATLEDNKIKKLVAHYYYNDF